jgi:ubiquitin carboxyl-terminal hydrolase L3
VRRILTSPTDPNSNLAKLLDDAIPLKPAERAELLYESQALETAHQAAASGGDTSAPAAEDNVDLHYVCFVKSQKNQLWELDGRRKGPLNRGELSPDEDVLSEKALDLGVRSFLKRETEAGGGDLRFSLITLAESFD